MLKSIVPQATDNVNPFDELTQAERDEYNAWSESCNVGTPEITPDIIPFDDEQVETQREAIDAAGWVEIKPVSPARVIAYTQLIREHIESATELLSHLADESTKALDSLPYVVHDDGDYYHVDEDTALEQEQICEETEQHEQELVKLASTLDDWFRHVQRRMSRYDWQAVSHERKSINGHSR